MNPLRFICATASPEGRGSGGEMGESGGKVQGKKPKSHGWKMASKK